MFSYILAITGSFILGAFSVLLVDDIRQNAVEEYPSSAVTEKEGDSPRIAAPQVSGRSPLDTAPFSFVEAVKLAAPAVVNIYTSRVERRLTRSPFFEFPFNNPFSEDFFDRNFRRDPGQQEEVTRSLGSGVIVDSGGYIVTNNHVIAYADDVVISFPDGRTSEATLIGGDPETDLAVLRVNLVDLPAIPLGNDEEAQVGDWVLAIGNPYSVGQTVTQGIISALGRSGVGISTYENFIQTDAAINPGNSGGALINTKGELWGINTAIFSRSGGSHGIGFAIPVNTVIDVVEQLRSDGQVRRGWMGVYLRDIISPEQENSPRNPEEESYRIYIAGVWNGGPADNAGLINGDEVISVDGQVFKDSRALGNYIASRDPGSAVKVTYRRDEETNSLSVTLSLRPKTSSQVE